MDTLTLATSQTLEAHLALNARNENIEKIVRNVHERRITPCHALFASFLAALEDAGVLNQAVVNFMAKRAGRNLHAYLKVMKLLRSDGGTSFERFKSLVESVNDALAIGERVEVHLRDGDTVLVGLGGRFCRYCPKGVGLAEIPGTACPFPRLIEAIARLEGLNVSYEPFSGPEGRVAAVRKEGGLCWIQYRIAG